jgi:MFS family permease
VYATSSGASGLHLALIFSGYAAAKILFSPVTGWWSDRKGRRRLLVSGLFLQSAIAFGYLFLPGPSCLIALRFLQGVAAAFIRPVSLAVVGDIAPERREGAAMGTFDISFYAALAVGPVLGGIVKDASGFRGIFLSLFCLCLMALATAILFVKNHAEEKGAAAPARLDWSVLKRSRTLIALCGFIFARSFGIVYFVMFLPVFMNGTLRLTGLEIGAVMGANTVVTALLLRPMGFLSDRVRRDRLVAAGGGAAALLTLCLTFAETFPQLLGLSICIGIAGALSLPASSALLVEEGGRQGMGLTMGVFNGAMNLGAVLAPFAGGVAFGLFGMDWVYYGAGMVGLAGTGFYLLASPAPALPRGNAFPGVSTPVAGASPLAVDRMRQEG